LYFLSHKDYINEKVIGTIGLFALLAVVVVTILLFLIVFIIPGGQNLFIPDNQPVLFFFCFLIIAFILRTISNLIQAALRGLFNFKAFNLYLLSMQIIPVIIYGVLLYIASFKHISYPLTTYFKIILVSETFLLLLGFVIFFSSHKIKISSDTAAYARPVFRYSFKNVLSP